MQDLELLPTKIFSKAEIYQVTFKVVIKKYIYIGLDTKCDPNYYGSSLVIYHYERVYSAKIFDKKILEYLNDISYADLCSIEQRYIRKSKDEAKKNNLHSINYTGENRRDSGPQIDIPKVGKEVIDAAKSMGLELRMASLSHGCIKPVSPPPPFDKASGSGMHIETGYGLKKIGFSFLRHRGSDNNIGLATAILRDLEFDDDSISTSGSPSDYQMVMASHNSQDPEHIADLYKRLVDMVWSQSKLFSNEPMDDNKPLPEKDILQLKDVTLATGNFLIKRYKGNYIRIYKDSSESPVPNAKAVLRDVNEEYNLNIQEKHWAQTQRAGKAVLDKLIQMGVK